MSNVTKKQLNRARKIVAIASVQNLYSLLRGEGEQLVNFCTCENTAFIPNGPLGTAPDEKEAPLTRTDGSLNQIAQHLEENVAAAAIELSDDELAALSRLSY